VNQTPTPLQPSLSAGEDTGQSDSDGIIDIAMPTLVGRVTPNALVTIYDNDFVSVVGTATADASGNYDVVLSQALGDGKHVLTATATAPGQTESVHSAPLRITVDTAAPDLPTAPVLSPADDTGASLLDGVTSKTVLHLTGRSEPGATVSLLVATATSGGSAGPTLVLATAVVAADGSYTLVTPKLADATYTLSVVARDVAGNDSKATVDNPIATTTVVVDTKAPAAPPAPTLAPGSDTGTLRSDGLTDETSPVVVGTTEANATVFLFDGDGTLLGKATADGNGAYAITSKPLAEGAHLLGIKAVDAAGNASAGSPPLAIVVDDTPPTGTVIPQPDSAIFGSVQFSLTFSEPVSGLTARALELATTGSAAGSVAAISGSGSQYVVTVEGLTGNGTVMLALKQGTVTDLAGNPATLTEATPYQVDDQSAPPPILIDTLSSPAATDGALSLSAGGRLIAFDSTDGLVAYDSTNAMLVGAGTAGNVYVKDVRTGTVGLVSAGLAGALSNGASGYAKLSADGSTIVFTSSATNLVAGAPTDGSTNVYVAHLAVSGSGADEKLVVSGITLVSTGNGHDGIGAPFVNSFGDSEPVTDRTPSLSADGTHVVFVSNQPLVAGMAGTTVDNIFEANLATGALMLVSGGPDGTGGVADSLDPTVSTDGSRVAYLGGVALSTAQAGLEYGAFESTVFDAATGTTTQYFGATQLGIDTSTQPGVSLVIYDERPVISSDGNWLTYTIAQTDPTLPLAGSYVVEQSLKNPSVIQVLSPLQAGYEALFPSINQGGRYVAYTQGYDSIDFVGTPGQLGLVLDDTVTGTKTFFSASVAISTLSDDGNAVAYITDPDSGPAQIYVQPSGAVIGVDAVGDDDRFGAAAWHQVQSTGLLVSGTTNQANTASVILTLSDAAGNTLATLGHIPVAGGGWSVTIPAATLAPLSDGTYILSAIVDGVGGASFPAGPAFRVDTTPPAAPDAPKLDPGSDSSLASDGTATNSDTPVLTGNAEAGATITLYDTASATPASVLGTAVADANGVYAISPGAPLINLTYAFAVTATDAAGNVSDLSKADTVIVDTLTPDTPNAPALAPAIVTATETTPGADTGVSDSDGITDSATPAFVGLAEPKSVVTLYDSDGVSVLGTGTASASGRWLITPGNGLTDGTHAVTVTASDAAGNVSAHSAADTVTIDTLPPLMPVITIVSGPLVNGGELGPLIIVTGTAEPGSTVSLRLDGGDLDLGHSLVGADGEYSIDSDSLPAGQHGVDVVATDIAGNASQPSLSAAVTITANPVPPPGTPPGLLPILALETDGPVAGATVFADANGNGVQDAGEATAVTQSDGTFGLYAPNGELIATGGIDGSTGLTPPGALTAPAGSSVITPLTTLLDAYAVALGADARSVEGALAALLGLQAGGSTDLTNLDPLAAALSGSTALDPAIADGTAQIVNAKLMDIAVDFTAAIIGLGLTQSALAIFADVFAALGQAAASLPAGGTLDLQSVASLSAVIDRVFALLEDPAGAVSFAADAAVGVAAAGDVQLATAAATAGASLLAAVAQTEAVEQGPAARALATVGNDQAVYGAVLAQFTGPTLAAATSLVLDLVEGPPQLAPGSDTGLSNRDNLIDIDTPTFVGIAKPGTYVTLLLVEGVTRNGLVIGTGIADATGRYSIVSAPLDQPSQLEGYGQDGSVVAVGSSSDPGLALGSSVPLPASFQTTDLLFDYAPSSPFVLPPVIAHATLAAAVGDDATHSALFLQISVSEYSHGEIQIFADGSDTPVASGSLVAGTAYVLLTTTPLSLGTHSLSVTLTEAGGTPIQSSSPYTVTITPATLLAGTGTVLGSLAGALIYGAHVNAGLSISLDAVDGTTTGGDGGYVAQPISTSALMLAGGYDTVTGEPLGGYLARDGYSNYVSRVANVVETTPTLLAPYDATAINPLTTIQALLDQDDDNPGGGDNPLDNQQNAAATLAAFGLSSRYDLSTLDPLALAEAGDPSPLLATTKLIDTVTLLSPVFSSFNFAPIVNYLENSNGTIDLDSATAITDAITTYYSYQRGAESYPPLAQYAAFAAVIAASNQAIDAHAAASDSVADTVSYALAASKVAQETETALVQQATNALVDGNPNPLPAIEAAYSGPALDAAIEAERAQLTQAISFVPVGASTTNAATVVFTIDFSRTVTGLSAADFTPITGGDLAGVHVTGVTAVSGSGDTSYDVSVGTGIGEGSLALAFSGAGLTGADGTTLTAGMFGPPTIYAPSEGYRLGGLAVGDFNGDGHPDVVVSADYDVTAYLNEGSGGFVEQPDLAVGNAAAGPIAVGDFNGDGKLDFVTLSPYSGTLLVRLGNGAGGFSTPVATVLPGASQMTVGDWNGDGVSDVAVVSYSSNTATILLGNGDGTFRSGESLATGSSPQAVATADLNGDGHADLVTANGNDGTVSVFLGGGDGTFAAAGSPIGAGSQPEALAIGDLNGDGIPDIAVGDRGDAAGSMITILLGQGDGSFTALAPLLIPNASQNANLQFDPTSIAIGDVNNDGRPDLVVGGLGTVVLLGNGDGTFSLGESDYSAGTGIDSTGVALADVDGDGRLDLLSASGGYSSLGELVDGLAVSDNIAEPVLGSASPAVTIDRAAVAQPVLTEISGGGTLVRVGNAYTLDLGTVSGAGSLVFSLANAASGNADSFDGQFSALGGSGFIVTGASLPAAVQAGSSYDGLTFTIDLGATGAHTGTITFSPRDATASVAPNTAPDAIAPVATTADVSVGLELAPITLTVTDDLAVGAAMPPTITGALAGQPGTDAASLDPFSGVVIGDPNAGQTVTVTVAPGSTANGMLSDPQSTADGGSVVDGSYQVSGTAAQVTEALQGLVFTPTAHQVAPGGAVTTGFTIAVADTAGQTATDAMTSVVATAAEDAPVIGGTQAGQAITDQQVLKPFAAVTVTDPDAGARETTTITLSANGTTGVLSGAGLTALPGGAGYVLSAADPATEQAELRALLFTPATGTETTGSKVTEGFTLAVSDGIDTASDRNTSVVVTQASTGTAIGDVHLVTLDGLHYDFQADGEFTLVRSTIAGNPFDVQIRAETWAANTLTSLTTEAAAQVGTGVVDFTLDGGVNVNGIRDTALDAAHPVQVLDGGTLTRLGDGDYQLSWTNGEGLTVSNQGFYLNLHATVAASDGPGSVQGLLGTLDGHANDLALPDGTVLAQPVSDSVLLDRFAAAWVVAGTGSLLDAGSAAILRPDTVGVTARPSFITASAPGEVLTGSLGDLTATTGSVVAGSLDNLLGDTIANMAGRDLINLIGVNPLTAAIAFSASPVLGGVLTVTDGPSHGSIAVLGSLFTKAVTTSDLHGGTLIRLE
jgi:hypothetical protein